jgi:hypothetical protein
METVKNYQEQAIIDIIQDSIVFNRIARGAYDIINAFSPKDAQYDFNVEDDYKGYYSALKLVADFNDDKLCGQLSEIFWNTTEYSKSTKNGNAQELAQTIYIEWLVCIKNYYATLKTVA